MKYIYVCLVLIELTWRLEHVRASSPELKELSVEEIATEKQAGLDLFQNAIQTLVYGGEDASSAYKDMFIDTSKPLHFRLDTTHGLSEMVTVDDMIRIFAQSVIVLMGSRRPDLIPKEFNSGFSYISGMGKIHNIALTKQIPQRML